MDFSFTVLGLDVSSGLLALGAITGMTYGILAVGLVLVHRSSGVINLAHGEIGAFGASICGVLVVRTGFPYWLALVVAVAASGSVGAATEMTVVRRLRSAPRLMTLVATLGVAQFLLAFSAVINSQVGSGSTFPQPSGMPEFRVGALLVTRAYSAMLLITPVVVVAIIVFLRRSRVGLAMRAAAANVERARMVGISAARMSTLAWALAGAVAAYTAVMIIPTRGFLTAEALGPALLLRALTPAVLARMSSLPVAMGTGIVVGLVDQILVFNYPTSGLPEVMLFALIVVALLLQSKTSGRTTQREDWVALQPWRRVPDEWLQVWAIRNLGWLLTAIVLPVAVVVGWSSTNATAVTLTAIVAFSLIGLSIGIVTGLGGQLTLGQFALAGVGATVSAVAARETQNFFIAFLAAAVVTAAVSVALGTPALRVRGLLLGVVTLSFALAAQRWFLAQPWMMGGGIATSRPAVGTFSFGDTRRYYMWSLGVLLVGYALARNVWRGGIGLRLRAVRDNEDGARAFGVSATATKLHGFAAAGALVGLGGAIYGHLVSTITPRGIDVVTSIRVVALTVLGGLGLLAGPLLGAIYIIGVPRLLPLDNAGLAATELGWLILIVYFPGGLAQVIASPRQRLLGWLARRHGLEADPSSDREDSATDSASRITLRRPEPSSLETGPVLVAANLTKRFGGIVAVDHMDLRVDRGEILGIIGPNGAGKTTLFEMLGGFTSVDEGRVLFDGADVTSWTPERRARRGLIRSFQDAALFPTLTVHETITLSFERLRPTRPVASMLGMQRTERHKESEARDLIGLMGLERHRHKQIRELSTGTRRITELACIVALEPKVLLLDEPSSGIAQRESEALGDLLVRLRTHLDCTILLIEHDIPLLMGVSHRVLAMDTGRVIADGAPEQVRNNSLVASSYLGGDLVAVERSGAGA